MPQMTQDFDVILITYLYLIFNRLSSKKDFSLKFVISDR